MAGYTDSEKKLDVKKQKVVSIMKQLFIIATISALFSLGLSTSSCKMKQEYPGIELQPLIDPVFQVSALTLAFNQEINNELKKSKTYKPSKKLLDKYGLMVHKDTVLVNGFAKLKEGYETNEIERIATIRGPTGDNLYTVTLPLQNLNVFYLSEGIAYFELSSKTTLTK
jgi:hypothetical protein